MPNMTLAIPESLKKRMDSHPELNWSELARQTFEKRIRLIEAMDKIAENSTLTEEDAIRLGRLVNKGLAKRYGLKKK